MWAIARDGSAFYRGAVSSQNPAGDTPFIHISKASLYHLYVSVADLTFGEGALHFDIRVRKLTFR